MEKMLILFSIIAFSTSCTHYSKKEIVDVSRKQELLIFPNNKTPTGYQLNVFAETDGEFKLQFLQRRWNSEKKDTISSFDLSGGKIDKSFKGDWYADTLFLLYTPKTVKAGVIKLKYSID